MDYQNTLQIMSNILSEKKYVELKIIDISTISSFCDYFIIVSTDNLRANNAMKDEFVDKLEEMGISPRRIEGANTDWILIDYENIIVHFFTEEKRLFYNLEKVWADGVIINHK